MDGTTCRLGCISVLGALEVFVLVSFSIFSLKRESHGLDLKPLFPWYREFVSGTNNPVHYTWWAL